MSVTAVAALVSEMTAAIETVDEGCRSEFAGTVAIVDEDDVPPGNEAAGSPSTCTRLGTRFVIADPYDPLSRFVVASYMAGPDSSSR